jgi:hypothetical protein
MEQEYQESQKSQESQEHSNGKEEEEKELYHKMFITDKIYYHVKKEKLYYNDTDAENEKIREKHTLINYRNWSKYLEDYNWNKIDSDWNKLFKKSIPEQRRKDYVSRWGVLDCGGDGDCLFHCLAEAFNNEYENDIKYTFQDVRDIAAECITEDNFPFILESYRLEVESDEFSNMWDVEDIESVADLQRELREDGNNYWGDYLILQLLQERLQFNVVIIRNRDNFIDFEDFEKNKLYHLAQDINRYDKTIILHYTDGLHFELVGYFTNVMTKLFKYNEIPNEMTQLINF